MSFLELYPHLFWRPDPVLYDCSNRTAEEWVARGTSQPLMGVFTLLSGAIIFFLYLLAIIAMSSREFLKHPCYQMIYFTSLNDISNLFYSNFYTGYYLIVGATFCTHPLSNFVAGELGTGTWCCSSLAIVALGFGRLAEVTGYGRWMFEGKMVAFWISLSLSYMLFIMTMTKTLLFNSTAGTWINTPFIIDDFAKELEMYQNRILPISNIVAPVLIATTYALIIITLMNKQKEQVDRKSFRFQRKLLLQCTMICSTQALVCFTYFYLVMFATPPWFLLVAQGLYQLNECSPLISYLVFNLTIRNRVLAMLNIHSSAVGSTYAPSIGENGSKAPATVSNANNVIMSSI